MSSPVVMAIGDSVTLGVREGVGPEQTFLAILSRRLGCQVINRAVGGEGIWAALNRAQGYRSEKPDVTLVMFGINDADVFPGYQSQRDGLWDFEYAAGWFLQSLIASGTQVILMTPTPWGEGAPLNSLGERRNDRLKPYAPLVRHIASKYGLPCVDHWTDWMNAPSRDALQIDHCHPNPAGHLRMADLIEPYLRFALTGR